MSIWDVSRKEVADSFNSRKFLLILGLFTLFSLGSVYMGINSYQQEMEGFRSDGGFSPEKPTLLDVFAPMLGLNMPLAAGLLALLLSYDFISREREEGTVELLLSYPVYRDEVINGKYLAGIFTLAISLLFALGLSSGLAVYILGVVPGINVLIRLSFVWLGTLVYMGFFMALGSFLSTFFRSSWRSLIGGVLVLLFSLATPLMANIAAGQIYQYDSSPNTGVQRDVVREPGAEVADQEPRPQVEEDSGMSREEVRALRDRFSDRVSRLSPTTSYTNYVNEMLAQNPEQEIDPTVSESIDNAIGYIIFLLSETFLAFTLSYAVFMRQDL